MVAVMLAVFAVATGYSVVLPLLPSVIESFAKAGGRPAAVARATGLLTGTYTVALFAFAPAWGWLSDRLGRRAVLLIGLAGFGVTLLVSALINDLGAVYAQRFLTGIFAAAVTPVAAAALADVATTEQKRARRLAFISMAGSAGFFLGPMLGGITSRAVAAFPWARTGTGVLTVPLSATALLAILAGVGVMIALPGSSESGRREETDMGAPLEAPRFLTKLLVLSFIVSAAVGVFEVGLALRGNLDLGLTPYQVGALFSECSLVMFAIQAVVFSRRVRPAVTARLITPLLAVLAIALLLVPRAAGFPGMLAVVGGVAAGAGVLAPVLTYWISKQAGSAQGWALGRQTAAASLGVTVGSVGGGLFFRVGAWEGGSFTLVAALAALGLVLSLGLPRALGSTTLPPE